jgi:hypothetical protein
MADAEGKFQGFLRLTESSGSLDRLPRPPDRDEEKPSSLNDRQEAVSGEGLRRSGLMSLSCVEIMLSPGCKKGCFSEFDVRLLV